MLIFANLIFSHFSGSCFVISDFDFSVQCAVEDTKRLPRVPESVGTTIVITFYNTDNE